MSRWISFVTVSVLVCQSGHASLSLDEYYEMGLPSVESDWTAAMHSDAMSILWSLEASELPTFSSDSEPLLQRLLESYDEWASSIETYPSIESEPVSRSEAERLIASPRLELLYEGRADRGFASERLASWSALGHGVEDAIEKNEELVEGAKSMLEDGKGSAHARELAKKAIEDAPEKREELVSLLDFVVARVASIGTGESQLFFSRVCARHQLSACERPQP